MPVSKGGPTRVGNLVAACRSCNRKKGNRDLEEFLAHDPERVRRIMWRADTVSYRDATHMNILMPSILEYASQQGHCGSGDGRYDHGLEPAATGRGEEALL